MNLGANVPDAWLLLRFDLERSLVVRDGARFEPLNAEKDWLRLYAAGLVVGEEEAKLIDFGLS